jgi:surface antigen
MKKFVALLVIGIFVAAGCSSHTGPKEGAGTLLGAAGGAIAGSNIGKGKGNILAIAVGTLAGALFGQEIGRSLDSADRVAMGQNAQYSLEYNRSRETTSWHNPDSGNSGSLTPTRTYKNPDGQYCREYQQTVTIGGRDQQAYGTACRQPDGSWLIIN